MLFTSGRMLGMLLFFNASPSLLQSIISLHTHSITQNKMPDFWFCSTLLLSFCVLSVLFLPIITIDSAAPPASFVFGDSLVDAGNNNYIFTLSKANVLHNGIDFAASGGRPTGRFTNGRTIPDIIGNELGLTSFAPPYLAPTTRGSAILQGVNYASGAAGILNETGRILIGRIPFDQQIFYFENTRAEFIEMMGEEEALDYLGRSIFSITFGANDYLNNYRTPVPISRDYFLPPQEYQQILLSRFQAQLTRLYTLGARKIVVVNVPPVGCTPYQRSLRLKINGDCAEIVNQLAINFNAPLKQMIIQLNSQLPGSHLLYANAYDIFLDLIQNHNNYGFEEEKFACCGIGGLYRGIIPCIPRATVCPDRSKYVFWDPFHPTEAAYLHLARKFLDGDLNAIFPMNIRQLIDI